MKNQHTNERGFTALDIILAVVALSAIGVAVYFALLQQSAHVAATATPTPTPVKTAASPSPSPTPASQSLVVTELGIQINNVPASLSDLEYAVTLSDSTGKNADFSTAKLSQLDVHCSPTGKVSDDGILSRVNGTYKADPQAAYQQLFVKQFSGFYISYAHPQAACSDNATTNSLQLAQIGAFQTLVRDPANITAIK